MVRLERLREAARALKREIAALAIAARDPRAPLRAKAFALFVVAYALSPVDLIPDFVPVLGLLDDLILVPLGLWIALRLMPPDLMAEARAKAREAERLPKNRLAGAIIVSLWLGATAIGAWFVSDWFFGEWFFGEAGAGPQAQR